MNEAAMNAGKASQIEIERDGKIVRFLMRCDSEYDAMMLYDRMTEEMRSGGVKLEIETKPRVNTELG
jgi:hypothetical protein